MERKSVLPLRIPVVAELQGIKYGAFSLSYGETKELVLGAGFLFLWDWAAQYYGLIEISYWSDTASIRYGNITNSTSIEKSSSSQTIKLACNLSNYTCNLKYVFIGL